MREYLGLRTLPVIALSVMLALTLACSTSDQEIAQQGSVETIQGGITIGSPSGQLVDSKTQQDSDNDTPSARYFDFSELPPSDTQDRGIWVTGSGVVEVEPDMAVVSLSVSVLGKTVALAQSQAGKHMSDVQETAILYGIGQKDIQTVDYSIRPEYHYEDVTIASRRQTKRVLDGYRVTNRIVVKLRDMGREGEIIDALATAGEDAIGIDDISFLRDDISEAQSGARELAIVDAIKRAKQIATTMGVTIGRPVYVREISATTFENSGQQMYAVRAYDESNTSTPIMGGALDITVKASVVFAIGDGFDQN
jgi:uncharacterized protein YggE